MIESNNTIDCIFDIRDKYIVLVKRRNEPFKDYWALPGGRQLLGETLDETVAREMEEEIGIKMDFLSDQIPAPVKIFGEETRLEQIRTYDSGKDPRGGNTTVYAIRVDFDPRNFAKKLRKGDDAKDLGVFKLNELPELAFDHKEFLNDYYKKLKRYHNPIPTTDVIIEYNGGIVLIDRKNPPYGLAIPGGFAELGLSLEENAVKEAKEETNLDVRIKNPGNPLVFSNPERDPRYHMISNTYIAEGQGELKAGDDAKDANVYSIEEVRSLVNEKRLVFDHNEILKDYLRLRK